MLGHIPLYITSFLAFTPVSDTVWWNTTGGKVIEHRDESGASCSLYFSNQDGTVVFTWDHSKQYLTVFRNDWQFTDDAVTIAVRLGDVWLDQGNGQPNIDAVESGNSVNMEIHQTYDDILNRSDQITLHIGDSGFFEMMLPSAKMKALLNGSAKCRAVAERINK